MQPDSDIDPVLVANDLPHGRIPRIREFDQIERRLEPLLAEAAQQGVHTLSITNFQVPPRVRLWQPLFLDMSEAILILDGQVRVLQDYLHEQRRRTNTLGSRRIRKRISCY